MKLSAGTYFGNKVHQIAMGDLILTEKVHLPAEQLPEHFHENAYFCLALNGGWQEFVNGLAFQCSAYDLVYHPAGELHRTSFSKISTTRTFNIEITSIWLEKLSPLLNSTIYSRQFSTIGKTQNPILRIYKEFYINDVYSPLAIEAALLENIAQMARSKQVASTSHKVDWLIEVQHLVARSFQAPLSLQEIAQHVHLHPVHLSRNFRKKMGCTLSEYYRRCRLEQACHFLKHTKLTLVEIALETGYYDQSHMCRDFQIYLKTSPLQYLKSHRQ